MAGRHRPEGTLMDAQHDRATELLQGQLRGSRDKAIRRMLTIPSGNPAPVHRVLVEISLERGRQDDQWGEQNHRDGTGPNEQILPGWTALGLAEAARALCQLHADQGIVTWRDIFGEEAAEVLAESDPARLRAELVQVVAVGVAEADRE
jgi:hypothetical protein